MASAETLQNDYRNLTGLLAWSAVFPGYDQPLMILNPQRQVVVANTALLTLLGGAGFSEVVGKRPGELLHCEVAGRTLLGCGTAVECRQCLALATIQASVEANWARNRVVLRQSGGTVVEMTVIATSLHTPDRRYTALTVNV